MPVLRFILHHIPDAIAMVIGVSALLGAAMWLARHPAVGQAVWRRRLVWGATGVGTVLIAFNFALRSARVGARIPPGSGLWISFAAISLVALLVVVGVAALVARLIPAPKSEHSAARRGFLLAARGAVFATPIAAAGYAVFIQRNDLSAREVDLPIAGLPKELNGLRLVQLSDIHLSPFLRESDLARAVDMANEFRAHLALVTGDLITTSRDPLDRAIAQIARLKTDAGTVGCMGNHEIYAGVEAYVQSQGARAGIDFLRSEARQFRFGGKPISIAGVDYQRLGSSYLNEADRLLAAGMPNILLSHNPDVFPVAAKQGWDATISGHTHGGQISIEILQQNVSVARFYTPYVYGLYRKGKSSIYVTRGIGTVGVPARLGAPPEIALIRLCAT